MGPKGADLAPLWVLEAEEQNTPCISLAYPSVWFNAVELSRAKHYISALRIDQVMCIGRRG